MQTKVRLGLLTGVIHAIFSLFYLALAFRQWLLVLILIAPFFLIYFLWIGIARVGNKILEEFIMAQVEIQEFVLYL